MSSGGRQYWIKTEQGRVWGPYQIDALERLRGQLTERAQASLDDGLLVADDQAGRDGAHPGGSSASA